MTDLKKLSGESMPEFQFVWVEDETAEQTQARNELVSLIRIISLVRKEINREERR